MVKFVDGEEVFVTASAQVIGEFIGVKGTFRYPNMFYPYVWPVTAPRSAYYGTKDGGIYIDDGWVESTKSPQGAFPVMSGIGAIINQQSQSMFTPRTVPLPPGNGILVSNLGPVDMEHLRTKADEFDYPLHKCNCGASAVGVENHDAKCPRFSIQHNIRLKQ